MAFTTLINVDELASQLHNPNWVVIDCRFSLADTSQGENHFAISRIPGAQYAHLDKHLSSAIISDNTSNNTGRHPLPDKPVLSEQFRQWGINCESQIVAYDDKPGAIASRLWWLSRWLGHEKIAVLNGGWAAWNANEHDIESGAASNPRPPGSFQEKPPLTQVVLKSEVLGPSLCLLDAREAERYNGEQEPIDPVAGHIPGALNAPFLQNISRDGLFKSKDALRERFAPAIAAAGSKQLVHYCGSGVTAAHNMLAMAHAGLEPGSMYAGSFSEWVSQPDADQYPVVRQEC